MQVRKPIFFVFFFLILTPLVFITDFYPFGRMGMFAQYHPEKVQNEHLVIYYLDQNNRYKLLRGTEIGLGESHFDHITYYYYKKQKSEDLLKILADKLPKYLIVQKLFLIKKEKKLLNNHSDSTVVAQWGTSR